MTRHTTSSGTLAPDFYFAGVAGLEDRPIPTSAAAGFRTSLSDRDEVFGELTGDPDTVDLESRVTRREFDASFDDARAMSADMVSRTLVPKAAGNAAHSVTPRFDRSDPDGRLGPPDKAVVEPRLDLNLQSLGVSASLMAQTVADRKAPASTRVTSTNPRTSRKVFNPPGADERQPGARSYHDSDPQLYFMQHLPRVFGGRVIKRAADTAQLGSALRSLTAASAARPAEVAVARADLRVLGRFGAAIPGATLARIRSTYEPAFAQGTACVRGQGLGTFHSCIRSALGNAAVASRLAWGHRVAADASAFFRAVDASPSLEVKAVVGSAPDPYKATVTPRPR